MKIQRVIPACVIMHIAPVPPVVPDAFETIQALRLLLVYLPQKPLFDPPAVIFRTVQVHLQGFVDELFLACHNIRDVPQMLRVKFFCPNMDMDPAAVIDQRAVPSQRPHDLLNGFNIFIDTNRAYQLHAVCTVCCNSLSTHLFLRLDAPVRYKLPHTVLCVPHCVCVIAAAGVFRPRSKKSRQDLRRFSAAQPGHFDLDTVPEVSHSAG